MKNGLTRALLALFGIVAFVAVGIALESELGMPYDTTLRIACAAICLYCFATFGSDYWRERWLWIGFSIALLVNIGLFYTPVMDRPTSRGEIMLFALPDTIIFLVARIASYQVTDQHQRAMRQQMILGLVVAIMFCAVLFAMILVPRSG